MNKYDRYATLRAQQKQLQTEIDALDAEILEEISSLSAPMKTNRGTFTTATRVSWKYSENVAIVKKAVESKIKEVQSPLDSLMKQEQEDGVAEKIEKTSLRFIEKKEGDGE